MNAPSPPLCPRHPRRTWAAGLAAALLLSACVDGPAPRTYDLFLIDKIARDGKIASCDRDALAAQRDIECANARRAATAVQLGEERRRREALERESASKIEALRREFEAQRAAAATAAAAEAAAYDEMWAAPPAAADDAAPNAAAPSMAPAQPAP